MANETTKRCGFCGKPENKVRNMFSSGDNHICDECVLFCYDILAEQSGMPKHGQNIDSNSKAISNKQITLKKPMEIKAVLDEYVIGQEDAKIALSVAVYNHYKRILSMNSAGYDVCADLICKAALR